MTWKGIAVVLFAIGLSVSAAHLWWYIREAAAVDSCLDSGGSYDYISGRCDHTQSHPFSSYTSRYPEALVALLIASGIPILAAFMHRESFALWLKKRNANRRIQAVVRRRFPKAIVVHHGATYINPRHLAFWTITDTDAQRDDLSRDTQLLDQFRHELLKVGYPAEAVPLVGFAFESQETIDRDFGGSWYHAMK
jgi:hypothetical protein